MCEPVLVLRDEEHQTLVPTSWRTTLSNVVKSFVDGDFRLERGIDGVRSISAADAQRIERNIESYGAKLIGLPESTWETSACQWMQFYWDVLIDLYTAEEGASDLALTVRVYEENQTYVFEVQSVHVP